ncbi:UNVERIFIED_CONTAM: hypothetical protein RMT77_015846 [Armadillidium vulgare]
MAELGRHLRTIQILSLLLLVFANTCYSKKKLIELDEDNWQDMLRGEWMVEFFAPWCPACKLLQPIWKDFASWSDDLGISVGQVDVTTSPGLSGRFMVTALPTIFHIKDGVFRQYRGPRDKDEFMSFIEEKKWQSLEEISAWKSPSSIQMSIVAQFFKLSMFLRGVHTSLVEEYGIPHWGSYFIFAIATILIGAILGLILVCFVDFIYSVRATPMPPEPVIKDMSLSGIEEEEDLIEDRKKGAESQSEDENAEEECASEGEGTEKEEEAVAVAATATAGEIEENASGASGGEQSEPEIVGAPEESTDSSSPTVRKRRARKTD